MHGRKTWLRTGQIGLYSEAKPNHSISWLVLTCMYVCMHIPFLLYIYLTYLFNHGKGHLLSVSRMYNYIVLWVHLCLYTSQKASLYPSCRYIGNFLQCTFIAIVYCCFPEVAWILTGDSLIAIGDLRGGISHCISIEAHKPKIWMVSYA